MRKVVFSLFAASSLFISSLPLGAQAQSVQPVASNIIEIDETTNNIVEQVSKAKATKKTGTYKFKYNTNVRTNAGTKYKRIALAKKGAKATATHQKKVGGKTWYKVKVNGKHGWVLSTLVTKQATAKKKSTTNKVSTSNASKASGKYKLKYNSNIRSNAGTKYKILTLGRKGTNVTVTHKKKVGNTTWYKVKVNGKQGWVSGTLLTKATAKKAPAKKATTKKTSTTSASKASGKYKLKYVSNVRSNAGTKYKVVTQGRKGATVSVTHKKKVGNTTWYKTKVNGKQGWVSGTLLTKATAKKAPAKKKAVKKTTNAKSGNAIVTNAKKHMGTKYVWGGRTPSGFDCSGYINYVFNQSGKSLTGNASSMYNQTSKVSSPKVGDLVFFKGTYGGPNNVSHVGIYIGSGKFIHASTSKGVTIDNVKGGYWGKYFDSYRSL